MPTVGLAGAVAQMNATAAYDDVRQIYADEHAYEDDAPADICEVIIVAAGMQFLMTMARTLILRLLTTLISRIARHERACSYADVIIISSPRLRPQPFLP